MQTETVLSLMILFATGIMLLAIFVSTEAFWISFLLLIALVSLGALGLFFNLDKPNRNS